MRELVVLGVTACVSITAIVAVVFGRNFDIRWIGGTGRIRRRNEDTSDV